MSDDEVNTLRSGEIEMVIISPQNNRSDRGSRMIVIGLVIVLAALCFAWFITFPSQPFNNAQVPEVYSRQTSQASQYVKTIQPTRTIEKRLPRIFWIYTENEVDSQPYQNDIFLNYYVQLAKKNGYQVRYANSWNSYDWIKQQKIDLITQTTSVSKIHEGVHSLLKLALLYDNGGIMMEWGNYFIRQDFQWLEKMFDKQEGPQSSQVLCSQNSSFLFMPKNTRSRPSDFSTSIIAAVPGSSILIKAFNTLTAVISTGKFPYEVTYNELLWNEFLGVYYMENSLETVINTVVQKELQKSQLFQNARFCGMGIQIANARIFEQFDEFEGEKLVNIMTSANGLRQIEKIRWIIPDIYFFVGTVQKQLTEYLGKFIDGSLDPKTLQRSSFLYRILSQPENKRVFIDPLPEREIQLCLVVMDPLTESQIVEASSAFDNQTYSKWKLVLPAADPAKKGDVKSPKVEVIPSYSTEVHIIEKALARHCPRKGYAVLLNKGENFGTVAALQQIADTVRPHRVLGLLTNIEIRGDNQLKEATQEVIGFTRYHDGIINPNYEKANRVLNLFRVFAIQTFLQIPQMEHRDIFGKYFEDRLIFLMSLLNTLKGEEPDPKIPYEARHYFLMKKYHELWNVGTMVKIMPKTFVIKTDHWEEVDRQQIARTRARIDSVGTVNTLNEIYKRKIPFSKIVAYNDAKDWVSVDDRKGPDLIPKIIHQIWLGETIPPVKQYFIDKTKAMFPSYEMKVWRQNNITRNLFPNTYDRIMTLLEFNKHSPFLKFASTTDIMRHQILYREGGFWKDAGVQFLKPILDKFLKFKLAIPTDRGNRYRWLQGMCFFANMPGYDNLLRINNYRNLNRMRIYDNDAMMVAGPIDFRQLLIREEEYDIDVLVMPYDSFYPGQTNQHIENDRCVVRKQQLAETDSYEIEQNGWYLLSNCTELYPYSFGLEHNRFGNTWQFRKST